MPDALYIPNAGLQVRNVEKSRVAAERRGATCHHPRRHTARPADEAGIVLTCVPQSMFSWDYRVSGLASGPALLTFDLFSERGGMAFDGIEFGIRKQAPLDACWILERDGTTFAVARKSSMLRRAFELAWNAEKFVMKAQSSVTRGYDLLIGNAVVGTIEPAHPFTRKAYVDCAATVPETVQLFSFWLAAMIWRWTTDTSAT